MRPGIVATCILFAASGCIRTGRNTLTSVGPEVQPPIAYFLDQSYVSRPAKPPRLIYEGHPSANMVFSQTLERAGTNVRTDTSGAWYRAYTVLVTPQFVIRQLSDSSSAVPPPSFMPKFTYQRFYLRKRVRRQVQEANDPVARERFHSNPRNWNAADLIITDFVFGHHSNGQAGCFYEKQELTPRAGSPHDYDCEWQNGDSSDRTINYQTGSFSTWFVRLGLGYEMMWSFEPDDGIAGQRAGALVSLQYHIPAMTEDPQKPLYGDTRLRVQAEYAWRFPFGIPATNLRVGASGDWSLNAGDGIPNAQRSIEVALISERLYGFGLYLRRYSGQDYYNINFTKSLNVTQFGVTIRYERPHAFVR